MISKYLTFAEQKAFITRCLQAGMDPEVAFKQALAATQEDSARWPLLAKRIQELSDPSPKDGPLRNGVIGRNNDRPVKRKS